MASKLRYPSALGCETYPCRHVPPYDISDYWLTVSSTYLLKREAAIFGKYSFSPEIVPMLVIMVVRNCFSIRISHYMCRAYIYTTGNK